MGSCALSISDMVAVAMSEPISFIVFGKPQAKQRPRVTKDRVVYTPAKTITYEHEVGYRAKRVTKGMFTGDVAVTLKLYFKNRQHLPDNDNVAKAILDGMNKIVYKDDSQISKLIIERFISSTEPERAEVEVSQVMQ